MLLLSSQGHIKMEEKEISKEINSDNKSTPRNQPKPQGEWGYPLNFLIFLTLVCAFFELIMFLGMCFS